LAVSGWQLAVGKKRLAETGWQLAVGKIQLAVARVGPGVYAGPIEASNKRGFSP
jgi:hypothetical protein